MVLNILIAPNIFMLCHVDLIYFFIYLREAKTKPNET